MSSTYFCFFAFKNFNVKEIIVNIPVAGIITASMLVIKV